MKNFTIAAVLALGFATASHAADGHKGHAHEAKAQHGGVVSVVKDMNYELVAKDGEVALYVSDHGQPASTARFTLP